MKTLILILCFGLSISAIAQKEKNKPVKHQDLKQQSSKKQKSNNNSVEDIIWAGTKDVDGGGPKLSKNQPAKVQQAFNKDYPNAGNVTWSKYRGDWTANFTNGIIKSTAVYHGNGGRKDTRTVIPTKELPRSILDIILKRKTEPEAIVKVETAGSLKDIFRIKTTESGTARYTFYDKNGLVINYNY